MLHRGKFRKFLINFVFFNLIFGLILLCLIHAVHSNGDSAKDTARRNIRETQTPGSPVIELPRSLTPNQPTDALPHPPTFERHRI